MTDATTTEAPASESRAIVPVRERLIVQAPVAIWDTADFEQMQRVAMVLTRSGLVPETICLSGEKDEAGKLLYLPIEVIAARCTLICNQARLWGADPLNVLQCTSLINGRLMYEGKLIAAVVASMANVKLRYRFGVWKTDHIEFPEDESGLHGAGESLAIRVYDPEDETRYVDGSVGQWKNTRSGSPWSSQGSWPRQLRYRGSREWARAYEPGVILGILADGDQEVDDFRAVPPPVGLIERLKGEANGDGFNHEDVQAATGGPSDEPAPKPRRNRRKAEEPAAEAQERPTTPEEPTATDGAPAAEGEPATSEPATPASEDGPAVEEASGPSAEPEAETPADEGQAGTPDEAEFAEVGHAAEGETYLMVGDGLTAEGTRLTYRDGVRFSTTKDPSKLPVYAEHAPELPEVEEDEDAEASPYDEETTKAVDAMLAQVDAAKDFEAVKAAMVAARTNGTWAKLTEEHQNSLRADVWDSMVEHLFPGDLPDHLTDVSAWRLWIEAQDDAEAVEDSLAKLEDSGSFQQQGDATKEVLRAAAYARINLLQTGGEG